MWHIYKGWFFNVPENYAKTQCFASSAYTTHCPPVISLPVKLIMLFISLFFFWHDLYFLWKSKFILTSFSNMISGGCCRLRTETEETYIILKTRYIVMLDHNIKSVCKYILLFWLTYLCYIVASVLLHVSYFLDISVVHLCWVHSLVCSIHHATTTIRFNLWLLSCANKLICKWYLHLQFLNSIRFWL